MSTTTTKAPSVWIIEEVGSWPGVEVGAGRRGELPLRLGRSELGHLHGDRAAHFGFPKEVWRELFAAGRISHHPVFPGKEGPAARAIADENDVRDVIAMMRLNYDRIAARNASSPDHAGLADLHPSQPEQLPFAPTLEIRAFVLRRTRGNLLIYSTSGLDSDDMWIRDLGGISRRYLNHGHEGMFASDAVDAPLFVHAAEREAVEPALHVRGTFSRRHRLDEDFEVIPTPGHTPGATAYLWDSGTHRYLFTGDTILLSDGEWRGAVLESSDREAYLESLDLIRRLDFDVLVPWAATRGGPYVAHTNPDDAAQRIGAMMSRIQRGGTG